MRHAFALISSLALAACGTSSDAESRDPGPVAKRSFDLTGFEKVALRGSDDVRVTTGSAFSITAEGPRKILDELELSVEDGTLEVGRKRKSGWSWSSGRGAVITVTMPAITGARLAGSGDMTVAASKTESFMASLAGSGDLKVSGLTTSRLEAKLAGSGDLAISGTASAVDASLAGSGDLTARDLAAETASLSLAGSGNASLRASGAVDVKLVGSGDVEVYGTDQCKVSKIGSGDVRCVKG